jgi:4-oxalomesaconate tautomerase
MSPSRAGINTKMALIARPRAGGHVCTRTFIPHKCHAAIGLLRAVSARPPAGFPGSVAEDTVKNPTDPSCEFAVTLEVSVQATQIMIADSAPIVSPAESSNCR